MVESIYGGFGVYTLPCLQRQDAGENWAGNRVKKIPLILPEMQAGVDN